MQPFFHYLKFLSKHQYQLLFFTKVSQYQPFHYHLTKLLIIN